MSTIIDIQNTAAVADEDLLDAWLGSLDGVLAKLRSGAMVADVGCGAGVSTVLMAQAFPRSAFTGYDAASAPIGSSSGRNVRFELRDAAELPLYAFDLVTSFGSLRDMADPLAVARRVRSALADDGTWMIVLGAELDLARVVAILDHAGFGRVRIAVESASDVVLEARP